MKRKPAPDTETQPAGSCPGCGTAKPHPGRTLCQGCRLLEILGRPLPLALVATATPQGRQ